ncbi:MAG: hypothetical protein GXX91_09225 [Verrucomicrobiaceae bacterium]|nr:hypothetical protein [Verrucomicrobiaceae bacterium]
MFRFFPFPVVVLALLAIFLPSVHGQIGGPAATYNDIARFVAGKTPGPGSPLRRLDHLPSVRRHMADSAELSKTWRERRLKTIRDWAKQEIHPRIVRPKIVKYPFSGPDFVHVAALFPGADEYILIGLEPLGTLPDFTAMADPDLDDYLTHLNHTLRSISQRSFFITKEMRQDFGKEGVDGVYPVLLYFAALTGHEVIKGEFIKLEGSGEAVVVGGPDGADGIWLQVRALDRLPDFPPTQNLYYFKTDLSNSGFKASSPMKAFLDQRPGGMAYLKAASYLMHTEGFTNIRNYLVGDCQYILQDESGIPAEFLATYYNATYYGKYIGPIDTFAEHDQPFLHRIYQSGVAKSLPFGTGYRMRDEDAIQIFGIRK